MKTQLLGRVHYLPLFDCPGYSEKLDKKRLTGLAEAVYNLMSDGRWRTFGEIKQEVNRGSENGIAATLRSFRKPYDKGGLHLKVLKQRRGDPASGLWEYRIVNDKQQSSNTNR